MRYTCKQCGLKLTIVEQIEDLELILHLITCPFINRSHTIDISREIYSANEWRLEISSNHSTANLYRFKDGAYNLASARFIVIETGLAKSLEKIHKMIVTDHHIDSGTFMMNTKI